MYPLEQGRSTAAIDIDKSFPLKSWRFEIKEYLSKPSNGGCQRIWTTFIKTKQRLKKSLAQYK